VRVDVVVAAVLFFWKNCDLSLLAVEEEEEEGL
jgi:hypothetical protein